MTYKGKTFVIKTWNVTPKLDIILLNDKGQPEPYISEDVFSMPDHNFPIWGSTF